MNKTLILFGTVFCSMSVSSQASNMDSRTWIQGDLGVGYQRTNSNLNAITPKDGYLVNGHLMFEYRSDSWGALGLALGGQQTWQEGATSTRLQVLNVRTFLLDASYLYPFLNRHFWVGARVSNSMGNGAQYDFSNTGSFQIYTSIGPQFRINIPTDSFEWVIGGSVLFGLNSPTSSIFSIPVYAGISIPLGSKGASPSSLKPDQPKIKEPSSLPIVDVQFDSKLVTFDVNKAVLKPASKTFLSRLAKVLIAQEENWKKVNISGHTDGTGDAKRNQVLSGQRAATVMNWLIQEGVPPSRLSSEGFGSLHLLPGKPLNSEAHRRVEFLFDGVSNGPKLKADIETVKIEK